MFGVVLKKVNLNLCRMLLLISKNVYYLVLKHFKNFAINSATLHIVITIDGFTNPTLFFTHISDEGAL